MTTKQSGSINTAVVSLIILCTIQVLAVGIAYGSMKTLISQIELRLNRIETYIYLEKH